RCRTHAPGELAGCPGSPRATAAAQRAGVLDRRSIAWNRAARCRARGSRERRGNCPRPPPRRVVCGAVEADLVARLEEKERQLERYAADLRETFKAERRRSQELRASYMATVRALANAVEARDAYTGHHAERVAAYGLELAHA